MPPPAVTSVRDRTPEFLSIVERLQKQQGPAAFSVQSNVTSTSATAGPSNSLKHNIQQQSEFARKASQIGLGIHKASVKLQKLAQLARSSALFDDKQQEIDELTGIVKADIQALNSSITELQRLSLRSREDNKQSSDHSHTVVDNLRSRLRDTTQEFKNVLTTRTENLKAHQNRRGLFSNAPEGITTPLLPRKPNGGAQFLFGGQNSEAGTSQQGGVQSQLQLEAPQESYTSSRAEALHNVESTIQELGSIFTQLAQLTCNYANDVKFRKHQIELVEEQGQVALRIDENIEDTLTNVANAQTQLLKYLNNISSNRWLYMKIFFVLLVFLVIFMVFIL